jgi:hypothetical protein
MQIQGLTEVVIILVQIKMLREIIQFIIITAPQEAVLQIRIQNTKHNVVMAPAQTPILVHRIAALAAALATPLLVELVLMDNVAGHSAVPLAIHVVLVGLILSAVPIFKAILIIVDLVGMIAHKHRAGYLVNLVLKPVVVVHVSAVVK